MYGLYLSGGTGVMAVPAGMIESCTSASYTYIERPDTPAALTTTHHASSRHNHRARSAERRAP
jgi:hypothetical protein